MMSLLETDLLLCEITKNNVRFSQIKVLFWGVFFAVSLSSPPPAPPV